MKINLKKAHKKIKLENVTAVSYEIAIFNCDVADVARAILTNKDVEPLLEKAMLQYLKVFKFTQETQNINFNYVFEQIFETAKAITEQFEEETAVFDLGLYLASYPAIPEASYTSADIMAFLIAIAYFLGWEIAF